MFAYCSRRRGRRADPTPPGARIFSATVVQAIKFKAASEKFTCQLFLETKYGQYITLSGVESPDGGGVCEGGRI